MKKWSFSSLKKFKNNSRISGHSSSETRHLEPKTRKKRKREELEGKSTKQPQQTGKVWKDFSHISYRMVGARALQMLI